MGELYIKYPEIFAIADAAVCDVDWIKGCLSKILYSTGCTDKKRQYKQW